MLSAVPSQTQPLGLFRLVLSLVAQRDPRVPDALQQHFLTILTEAQSLKKRPSGSLSVTHAESVDLAVEMIRGPELAQSLEGIENFQAVSPEIAHQVLMKLGHHPAY